MAELTTALVLESTRVDAEVLLTNVRIDPDQPKAKGVFGRAVLNMDPGRVEYWTVRIAKVFDEIEKESELLDNGEPYGITFVLAPAS